MGSIGRKAGAMAVSGLVTLLVLELGLRIGSGLYFPRMMVLDDKLGWKHATNVQRTFDSPSGKEVLVVQNAWGLRGRPPRDPKPADTVRVLALGDSFTEGTTVDEDELFTTRMERAEPRLEVLNAGVSGYGTIQEYVYLASEGLRFAPDLVLLMVYENDLADNAMSYFPTFGPRPYGVVEDGRVRIVEKLDPSRFEKFILPAPGRLWLNEHSYLYYLLNSRVYQRLRTGRMREMQRADMRRYDTKTEFEILFHAIGATEALLHDARIPLVAVYIPIAEDVEEGRSRAVDTFTAGCRERGFDCLALLDPLHRETAAGRRLYYTNDIHWNADGNEVAAAAILEYLRGRPDSGLAEAVPRSGAVSDR